MEDKARFVAVSTLYDMDVKKSYSNIKINEYFSKYELNSVDRGFATEIIYGTIRWKLKIDYALQKHINSRLDQVPLWVLACLRAAVYQIYFMDKVPDFAAVNAAVELTKTKELKAAAFTNGVLRSLLRSKDEFDKIGIRNKTKRLSIEYSHPEWFVKKYCQLFGEDFTIALMKTNNTPPPLTARVNTLKNSRQDLIRLLLEQDVSAIAGVLPESLIFDGYSMIERSKEFQEGRFLFQDEGSMLVSRVLAPQPGDTVIDLCSAPGGKTTHMAQLMKNEGKILAFDIHKHKLGLIRENAEKLGLTIVEPFIGDATQFNPTLEQAADHVLVDAPCSGLGLIRKKPEIRWNLTENDVIELSKLQLIILKNASRYVKIGGSLVYSTCTISEEENEQVTEAFLKDNDDFEPEEITTLLPEQLRDFQKQPSSIRLFPNQNNTDGFYITKFKRVRG